MKTIQVRNISIGEGPVKICVPLVAGTKAELMPEARNVAARGPDLIEWRVDFYEEAQSIPAVLEALAELREAIGDIPLIFTFRVAAEGGRRFVPEKDRFQTMKAAMEAKLVDLLDIEFITEKKDMDLLVACAKDNGIYTIISSHYFEKTPPVQSMVERLLQIQETGADIAKLAVMPACNADVLNLLNATHLFKEKHAQIPFITISMSRIGLISRVAGSVFGSCITFGAGLEASAPGQIEVSKLRDVCGFFFNSEEQAPKITEN